MFSKFIIEVSIQNLSEGINELDSLIFGYIDTAELLLNESSKTIIFSKNNLPLLSVFDTTQYLNNILVALNFNKISIEECLGISFSSEYYKTTQIGNSTIELFINSNKKINLKISNFEGLFEV